MPAARGQLAWIGRRRRRTLPVKRFLGYPTSPGPVDAASAAQIGPSSARATGAPGIRIDACRAGVYSCAMGRLRSGGARPTDPYATPTPTSSDP
jgi:hypothetical protein